MHAITVFKNATDLKDRREVHMGEGLEAGKGREKCPI